MRAGERFPVRREALRGVEVDVVAVDGDVDLRDAQALSERLTAMSGPTVVDLRECTFMGSDGVRALLEGRRAATEHGERLVLAVTPGGRIARLLEVVGARTIFNVQATMYEALTAASSWDRRQVDDRRSRRAA